VNDKPSGWIDVVPFEEITLHLRGAVSRHPKAPGVYVTLQFMNGSSYQMHEELARQLRDWLNTNLP
jgi:hypothetical protein